jgi:16S rRNA (guanine966-N2)-methyltransferase
MATRPIARRSAGAPPPPRHGFTQRVRIIGGHWRRRLLTFPAADDLRPTPDRVRETVFNWLGQDLRGLHCLDLFAGSGALGFEAASRGAQRVVMVEQDARIGRALEACRSALGVPPEGSRIEIVKADALRFLDREARHPTRDGTRTPDGRFDVVFLDPPFRLGLLPTLLPRVDACLAPGGWVYVEAPAAVSGATGALEVLGSTAPWATIRQARAGAVEYRMLARQADLQQDANGDSLAAGRDRIIPPRPNTSAPAPRGAP